ncbi:MAG: YfcE family phosphodiesterase [Ignisphaera sp.]|nr:YfcE family phosphodiesterase [Ignisphaera sp.]MCX8168542.1 YfcE family phosphodiesterase [Ignisphaera sp.]MDW8085128.1 YfcE family phosphodiesterase [Ignisphaera sp.]
MEDVVYGLIIGDSHIRERAEWFPQMFVDHFKNRTYDFVIHTGDLVDYDVIDYVKSLANRAYIVQGNMDYLDLPEHQVFEVFSIPIGVIHGDQARPRGNIAALTRISMSLGVLILVSGHTHTPFIIFNSGVLHINPGSVTGVWGGGGGSMTPSYVEIEILRSRNVDVRLYQLEGDGIVELRRESVAFA